MKKPTFYIDLHCHPALKPFGKSLPNRSNSRNPEDSNSVWHAQGPSRLAKMVNRFFGLTKFRQSDFQSVCKGKAQVICAALYPMEKSFLVSKFGTGRIIDKLSQLAVGVSRKRINEVQGTTDYFTELEAEYDFYRQLDGKIIDIDDQPMRYRLVKSFSDIAQNQLEAELDQIPTVSVVLSIEGGHAFNTGIDPKKDMANPTQVMDRVIQVKNWEHAPFFLTFAHHFYNELCGHAASLNGLVAAFTSQKRGQDTGMTELGKQVIHTLLDEKKGRRIFLDIKHMSIKARQEYFRMLREEYAGQDIPIVVSHGAVNGKADPVTQTPAFEFAIDRFLESDINFYDSELVKIAKSGGIFGIQMDERRVASKKELKRAGGAFDRNKRLYRRSRMYWNQIQHIASVLDFHGLDAWSIQSIGSDFDGIIDPINGFWTHADLPLLASYLTQHATEYLAGEGRKLRQTRNRSVSAAEIIERVSNGNATRFMKTYYTEAVKQTDPVKISTQTNV